MPSTRKSQRWREARHRLSRTRLPFYNVLAVKNVRNMNVATVPNAVMPARICTCISGEMSKPNTVASIAAMLKSWVQLIFDRAAVFIEIPIGVPFRLLITGKFSRAVANAARPCSFSNRRPIRLVFLRAWQRP